MAKHKYISQDEAIDAVDVGNLHHGIIDALQDIISEIPAADVVEVVHGTWEGETDFIYADLSQRVICDKCGEFAYFYDKMPMNFCPNCGADMREVTP